MLDMRRGNGMEQIAFGDIEDIKVGHAHNLDAATGCTVVICEKGATGGVDVPFSGKSFACFG